MRKNLMEKIKRPRLKPITLWPLKPSEALRAFMQVDPKRVKRALRKERVA